MSERGLRAAGPVALLLLLLLAALNFTFTYDIPGIFAECGAKFGYYSLGYFYPVVFLRAWAGNLWGAAVAATLFIAALAAGPAVAAWARAGERFLSSLGLGLGILGLGWLGAGLCGLVFPHTAALAAVAGMAVFRLRRRGLVGGFLREAAGRFFLGGRLERVLVGAAALTGLVSLVVALGEEGGWDPAYYHLRLPKLFAMHHRIFFVPYIYPSHYPQAIESLFGLAWLGGGEGAAKLVNFTFWPLCGLALMELAAPWGAAAATRAAALALSMPLVGTLASESYIDLGLTFFILLALESAWRGRAVAAGLFLGLAMGSKYTAIHASLALLVSLLLTGRGWRMAAVAAAAAVFPLAPWLARNLLFTGDPVAPFLYGTFGTMEWAWGISQAGMWEVVPRLFPGGVLKRILISLGAPWEFLKHGSFAVFSPFVLGMLGALAFRVPAGKEAFLKRWVLVFTALVLAIAPDGRYWQPAAFPFCVLAVAVWGRMEADGPLVRRWLAVFAAYSAVFGGGYHALDMHRKFTGLMESLGLEDPAAFQDRTRHPAPWYAMAVNLLNRTVPERERVAVVSDVQAYMIDRDAIFDCDACLGRWLERLVEHCPDSRGIARQFRQWNCRTVLYIRNKSLAVADRDEWRAPEVARWAAFWNPRASAQFRRGECVVYILSRAPGEARIRMDLPGPQEWAVKRMMKAREEGDKEGRGRGNAARRAVFRMMRGMGIESAYMHAANGELAMAGKDYGEAVASLRRAVALSPDFVPAWYSLALALLRAGERREAEAAAAKYRELEPLDTAERKELEREFAEDNRRQYTGKDMREKRGGEEAR